MTVRVPWLTVGATALAIAIWVLDNAVGRWVEYDRAALAAGQWWRLLTGHWAHWSTDHWLWDTVVFAAFGVAYECRVGGRRLARLLVGAALAISLALIVLRPDLVRFRGLSGLDCALVVALATTSIRRAVACGYGRRAVVHAALLLAYGAKITYEMHTGDTLFVDASTAPFSSVALAHVIGGLCGAVAGFGFVPEAGHRDSMCPTPCARP